MTGAERMANLRVLRANGQWLTFCGIELPTFNHAALLVRCAGTSIGNSENSDRNGQREREEVEQEETERTER